MPIEPNDGAVRMVGILQTTEALRCHGSLVQLTDEQSCCVAPGLSNGETCPPPTLQLVYSVRNTASQLNKSVRLGAPSQAVGKKASTSGMTPDSVIEEQLPDWVDAFAGMNRGHPFRPERMRGFLIYFVMNRGAKATMEHFVESSRGILVNCKWRHLGMLVALLAPWYFLHASNTSQVQDHADTASAPQPHVLRLLDLGLNTRFNYMDTESGVVTDRGIQYRLRTRLQVNVRKDETTYFVVRAETGKGFDNSWNNTGVGLGERQSIFNVKGISLFHKFGNKLHAELGGLDFDRGAGTDAIYASGDGHITGYRAVLTDASTWLPDKVSVTGAFLGDFNKPNFFSRARMDRINYVQVLVENRIADDLDGSVEFDSIHGVSYARGAIRSRHLWVFDEARLEAAVRLSNGSRIAWSSSVSRRWGTGSRWRGDLIYADLPSHFYKTTEQRFLWNRGEIDVGKRVAAGMAYRVSRDCEASAFAGRLLDSTPSKGWIAQAGVSYQLAGLVNRFMH